jgi:hypothetical protein
MYNYEIEVKDEKKKRKNATRCSSSWRVGFLVNFPIFSLFFPLLVWSALFKWGNLAIICQKKKHWLWNYKLDTWVEFDLEGISYILQLDWSQCR